MAFMDEDRDGLLADFGVDVTVGADTVEGIYGIDEVISESLDGLNVAGTEEVVLVKTPAPASFVRDATMTITGEGTRTIRRTGPAPPDGRWTAVVVV